MLQRLIGAVHRADEGYWDEAHTVVQQIDDPLSYWLHANLHREEGDLDNARYWYHRAQKPFPESSVPRERRLILDALEGEA